VHDNSLSRRRFLAVTGATSAGIAAGATLGSGAAQAEPAHDVSAGAGFTRRATGYAIRLQAANNAYARPFPTQTPNGEESIPGYLASYTKGLPHNDLAEVDPAAYEALVRAINNGNASAFERIPLGTNNGRKLLNPRIVYAFDLQGPDSHGLAAPPAPRLDSAEFAGEMVEDYWMALLRDVPFTSYLDGPQLVLDACESLSRLSGFRAPKENGRVTPRTLFRGFTPGDLVGPFVSQFLLKDFRYGPHWITQRQDTVQPGVDFLTDFAELVEVQRGAVRPNARDFNNTRYIQTARDLAHFTHVDVGYQPYLYAAVILLTSGLPPAELFDPANPYINSRTQQGFGTFGIPHILTLLAEVDHRARKANLYQQWGVHRRIRPEAVGARIDVHLRQDPGRYDGLLNSELLESDVLDRVHSKYGTYLLPQAYEEGSPMSPDYVSGHATVAGACVTILKAWFNESTPFPDPVVPDETGTRLVPYRGADRDQMTIGGELNKLAANIGTGRNTAGVHWRSAYREGLAMGEQVAIGLLRDQKATYHEDVSFSLTRFDGTTIRI